MKLLFASKGSLAAATEATGECAV